MHEYAYVRVASFAAWLGITAIAVTETAAAATTCAPIEGRQICCDGWVVEVSRVRRGLSGEIDALTYDGLIKARDEAVKLETRWCRGGDPNFCGTQFGPPKCSKSTGSQSSQKGKTIASDPGALNYGKTVIVPMTSGQRATLQYPTKQNYDLSSALVSQVLAITKMAKPNTPERKAAEDAWGAVVDARNGFYGTNNQFGFLKNADLTSISNADHYLQLYSLGVDGTAFQKFRAVVTGSVADPVYNLFKWILNSGQPEGTPFMTAGTGPQSPANFHFWALAGAVDSIDGRAGQ